MRQIVESAEDDYSDFINMYPISSSQGTSSGGGSMEKAMEKARKAIKLHSIKKKPRKNLKKWKNPKYRSFYEQQEFNPVLKEAWMLLAQAEFHKGDFLGSTGTFSYISKHYAYDTDMVIQCQLWTARAYTEMGWLYEAEEVLSKINPDHISRKNTGLFASIKANWLMKSKRYEEAIPFLELAVSKEKDKRQLLRFNYILAQLYQHKGNNAKAYEYYSRVIRKNPPYLLDFNARMNRIRCNEDNLSAVRKELNRMIRNSNNKNYLDQLYHALGNTYLQEKDTATAITYYVTAADTSARSGIEKALVLLTLGDLYYEQKNYTPAHAAYEQSVSILPNTHDEYARVSRLSETLGELVAQQEIVVLQDSLLHLSELSRQEQLEVVNKIIERVVAEEKAAEERAEREKLIRENESTSDDLLPLGMTQSSSDWYFYNRQLILAGQREFQRRWGRRKLEDNWRRSNKSTSFANTFYEEEKAVGGEEESENRAENSKDSISNTTTDNKKPEFYLSQIPNNPEQKKSALSELATALFQMGLIYKDKIEDFPMAEKIFEDFVLRFKSDERVPDAYFQQYIMCTRKKDKVCAESYRSKLTSQYPQSKYAQILVHDDYAERFRKMLDEQDSIYGASYRAYSGNDFAKVFENTDYMRKNYPLSTLMPKFLFLEALSIGKTGSAEGFDTKLSELLEAYPESDVSAMAKDLIALIRQGQEAQSGTSHASLLARREGNGTSRPQNEDGNQSHTFSEEKQGKHRLILLTQAGVEDFHRLTYQLASYNFSRFMIKEFDLQQSRLDSLQRILSVTGFESFEEAGWYNNSLRKDPFMQEALKHMQVESLIISEENFALLRNGATLREYRNFIGTQATQVEKETMPKKTKTEKRVDIRTIELPAVSQDKKVEAVQTEKDSVKKEESSEAPLPPAQSIEEQPLFKGLYAYQPEEPHHIAIYILAGTVDTEKLRSAFEAYNSQHYSMLNLSFSSETVNGKQILLIGSFPGADLAKSYFLRMIKEKSLFTGMKGLNYRNILGTQRNLNVMMQQNALNSYFEFMREYYLK